MIIQTQTAFRDATIKDCPAIAHFMQIASDGVCDYIWSLQQAEFPHLTPLEIGAKRYAESEGNFSYRSCVMALDGTAQQDRPGASAIQGMMMAFAIPPADLAAAAPATGLTPEMTVLAPYGLEQPNSWYICALAVLPPYRGQGIGTQLLDLATVEARSRGISALSLLCFEQNVGALRLYQRYGFQTIDRAEVVPHPLIHHTGEILLMSKSVSL